MVLVQGPHGRRAKSDVAGPRSSQTLGTGEGDEAGNDLNSR